MKCDLQKKVAEMRAARRTGEKIEPTFRPASPSKSALRDVSSVSPSKTPRHKRKVIFSPVKDFNKDDLDSGVEDTPSKRQKFVPPGKYTQSPALLAFQEAVAGKPSSSKDTLEVLQGVSGEHDSDQDAEGSDDVEMEEAASIAPPSSDHSFSDADTDVVMSDTSTSTRLEAASSSERGPMTPRRSQRQAKPRFLEAASDTPKRNTLTDTPRKRSKAMTTHLGDDLADVVDARRRNRPVLLEYKQWLQRDPRVEREKILRQQWVKEQIEKRGSHPFESLRNTICT